MKKLKSILLAAGLALAAGLSATPWARAAGSDVSGRAVGSDLLVPIVIYHTNDIHGQIGPSPENKKYGLPPSGGAASLATVLKSEPEPYMYFDSGDWFQGTPVGNLTQGKAVVAVLNALELDAAVLGNHEFDYGMGVVKDLVSRAKFPVLASNMAAKDSDSIGDAGVSFIMRGYKGLKIGVLGVLPGSMDTLTFPQNYAGRTFSSPVSAAARSAEVLRAAGADVVVALSHAGIEEYGGKKYGVPGGGDIAIAQGARGIDVILGGHTHTRMTEPVVAAGPGRKGVLITQTGGSLREVFRIVLYFNPLTRQVDRFEAKAIALDPAAYPPDPAVARLIAGFDAQVAEKMGEPLGSSLTEMPDKPYGESALHNWVADVYRNRTQADLAVVNAFGLRAALPAGDLTYGDVYKVLPFDNVLAVMELKGSELRKLISRALPDKPGGVAWLHYSGGVRVVYDPSAKAESRLLEARIHGEPLNDERVYSVAADNFVAEVSHSIKGIRKESYKKLNVLARDAAMDSVRAGSPISSRIEGRLQAASAATAGSGR